jgi:mannose-6-phosphate isomerase-like protein (cupin superfamily)
VGEREVDEVVRRDDTARVRLTIGAEQGCERLEQRVVRFASGTSEPFELNGVQALLYVAAGRGRLHVDGEAVELEPDTGAYVAEGESYRVENPGPGELVAVVVTAPKERSVPPNGRRAVRYGEREALPATAGREFRYLVDRAQGCHDVTQFLGIIPPGRAPMHSHTYDEVVYIVEGEGVLHLHGEERPIAAGSCMHLPPLLEHCLENRGEGAMRVLGVFHPAGDPASRASDAGEGG